MGKTKQKRLIFSSPACGGSGRAAVEGGERSDGNASPLHHFVVPLAPQAGEEKRCTLIPAPWACAYSACI